MVFNLLSRLVALLSTIGAFLQQFLTGCLRNRWTRRLIRFGFAAKGSLYGLIGIVALGSLWLPTVAISGMYGVLVAIFMRPFGRVLLLFLAAGLFGYVLWRLIQAGADPEHDDSQEPKRMVQRVGYLMSATTYLGVAYKAVQFFLGFIPEEEDSLEDLAGTLFDHEIGPWLLLLLGLGVMAVGLSYVYGGWSGSYLAPISPNLPKPAMKLIMLTGKIGFTARGAGFILIAAYLVKASLLIEANSVGKLGDVLKRLDEQPGGDLWLGAIAFGFIAYAIYMVFVSRWRKFL